jgi:hypothetical protein
MTAIEALIYKDKKITPMQQSLLDGPNFRQYPAQRSYLYAKIIHRSQKNKRLTKNI